MKSKRITGRPVFLFCSVYFLISVIFALAEFRLKAIAVCGAIAVMLAAALPCFAKRRRLVISVMLSAVLALTVSSVIGIRVLRAEKSAGEHSVIATIESVDGTSDNYGFYTANVTADTFKGSLKVRLGLPDRSLIPGDVLSGTVRLTPVDEDAISLLYSEGIFMNAESEGMTYIETVRDTSIKACFARLNSLLSSILVQDDDGGLSAAVLLGNKSSIPLSLKRDFSRLGISHLLALSGLHLSVIVNALSKACEALRVSQKLKCAVTAVFIVFYMALTAFPASLMRAGFMHLVRIAAELLDRENDPLTSLSVAAVIILVLDPLSAFDVGFILSVLAAYACVTYTMMNRKKDSSRPTKIKKFFRGILDTVKMTVWITLITLPVMWYVFGEISVISPLTNVIFIPLLSALLYQAAGCIILCKLPLISQVIFPVTYFLENAIESLASDVSHLPYITSDISASHIGVLSVILFSSAVLFPLTDKKAARVLRGIAVTASALVIVSIVLIYVFNSTTYSLSYITKSKSNSLVLRDGNSYYLIDISDGSGSVAYEMYLRAKEMGGTEINTLILTHLHLKHVSAVDSLTDRMITRTILLPSAENEDEEEVLEKIVTKCKIKKITTLIYSRVDGEIYSSGTLSLSFHDYTLPSRSTHPTVTFSFTLGGNDYCYGGGSWSESDGFTSAAAVADTVFLGSHSPKTKLFPKTAVNNCVISYSALNPSLTACLEIDGSVHFTKDHDTYTVGPCKRKR